MSTPATRPQTLKQRKSNMATEDNAPTASPESEPLLGQPGDASQVRGGPMWYNLFIGTAVIAQAGIWILFAVVWGAIFSNELILFSAHPLLNSTALLLTTQAILLLQPTHTATQRSGGARVHLGLNNFAFLAFLAGFIVIEYNKFDHGGTHFKSPHSILGFITYIFILLQSFVGFTMFLFPSVYGGVGNAKAFYKYHRNSGYVVLLLALATVCASTKTDYSLDVLHIRLWGVVVAAVLVVIGVFPRIKRSKLGF